MHFLIADDHVLFSDSLEILLKRSFFDDAKVSMVENVDGACRYLAANRDVDLLLLDFRMPGMKGIEGLRRIASENPNLKIALMSGLAEDKDIKEALDTGAMAYLPKTLSKTALVSSIKLVLQGYKFAPLAPYNSDKAYYPSYKADEIDPAHSPLSDQAVQIQEKVELLSRREKDVLHELLHGASNQDIADQYDLQVSTVKIHVRNICQKMEVKNRTQAALMAQSIDFKL